MAVGVKKFLNGPRIGKQSVGCPTTRWEMTWLRAGFCDKYKPLPTKASGDLCGGLCLT